MKKRYLLILLAPYLFSFSSSFDHYSTSRQVLDDKGKLLRMTLSKDDKYRLWTPLDEIPSKVINAFLSKEDRYFYYHPGFNPISLIKSAFNTYVTRTSVVGGSTITMQLARLHYSLRTRSISGKLKQIILSYWLEVLYSKKEILEAYLNITPYGRNIEGIAAASKIYFQKNLDDLLMPEILLLAVTPQRPSALNDHLSLALAPQSLSLAQARLAEQNKIRNDLELYLYGIEDLPFKAPHLSDLLLQSKIEQTIETTLNSKVQKILEQTVSRFVEVNTEFDVHNAAAVLLDFESMQIKGYLGSADFHNNSIFGQVNGINALRSPGSTLKPFIYALAFEQGLMTPQSLLYDAPLTFKTPENYDRKFLGPVSVEKALILSRNVPAVDAASKLGSPNFYSFLRSLFPERVSSKNIYGSSLALGGVEFTMMDLVKLYAALANQGRFQSVLMTKKDIKPDPLQILKPESTAMIMDILAKHPRPGAHYNQNFVVKDFDVFWKTGTSFGFRDAWAVGVMGHYVLAVWVGNFSGKGNPYFVGSKMAGPLFFEIIDRIKPLVNKSFIPMHRYANKVKEIDVCALSGKIPHKHCPHTKKGLFWPGVSSIKKCDIHRRISISKKTGLRTCHKSKEPSYVKIAEIWPTHAMEVFESLGIPRKAPPTYSKECRREDYNSLGQAPVILTPHKGLKYTFRPKNKNTIAFKAKADNDVKKIFWYVNEQYIGVEKPDKPFFWQAHPGKYTVRAIDDHGRQSSRQLKVISLSL